MARTKQLLIEAILRFQPLAPFHQALQIRVSAMSIPPRRPRPRTRSPRSTPPGSPSNPNIPTHRPHHTSPPSFHTFTLPASSVTIQAPIVGRVQEATRCRPCLGTTMQPPTPTTSRVGAACPPYLPSSPPSPLESPTFTPTPAHQRLKTCFTTQRHLPPTRTPSNVPRRKCGRRKSVQTECPANGSPGKERRPTSGSSCSNSFRTRTAAPSSSNGATERRGCSSWSTARLCPDFGVCTRTNQTWTTRQWAGRLGNADSLKSVRMFLYSIVAWQVLLSTGHSGQSGRPTAGLSVRRCAQDWRHPRSRLQWGVIHMLYPHPCQCQMVTFQHLSYTSGNIIVQFVRKPYRSSFYNEGLLRPYLILYSTWYYCERLSIFMSSSVCRVISEWWHLIWGI